MKKAQIEIIGLLMVVILVLTIVLITLWFILKPKQDILIPQRQAIQINSILLTLIKTTYEINTNIDIRDKILECSYDNTLCTMVKDKINGILNEVLKNKEYILEIKVGNNVLIRLGPETMLSRDLNNPCDVNKIKTRGSILVDVQRQINAILVVCTIGEGIL